MDYLHQPKDIHWLGKMKTCTCMHLLVTTSPYLTPQIICNILYCKVNHVSIMACNLIIFYIFVWLLTVETDKCLLLLWFSSVQFSHSVMSNPMDCSTSGLPVHHQLLELTQTHVHWVSDAIQPSHPLWSPLLPIFSPSIFLSIRVFSNEFALHTR